MYTICLNEYNDDVYFTIKKKVSWSSLGALYDTSKNIAKSFDISLDEYNHIVIDKVIGHTNYTIRHNVVSEHSDIYCDLMFEAKKSKEFYIDKFKEVFAPQLTLLTIEG